MSVAWGLTVDCARPRELAAFWALALGYVEPPPPAPRSTASTSPAACSTTWR